MKRKSLRSILGLLAVSTSAAGTLAAACGSSDEPHASSSDAAVEAAGPVTEAGQFQLDGGPELQNWLLAVGNTPSDGGGYAHPLGQISILPGDLGAIRSVICPDIVFAGTSATNDVVSSLTFYDDVLYGVGAAVAGDASTPAAALYRIDPCTCTATRLGTLGAGVSFVGSITSYGNRAIYGIASTNDALFTVDPTTGAATIVKTLAVDFGASGLSWSGPERDTIWGIESNSDSLYEMNAQGDFVRDPLKLDYDFAGLGMEYHPGAKKLFACSNNKLLEVNVTSGHVDVGPEIAWDGGCANLAAPFGPVGCIANVR